MSVRASFHGNVVDKHRELLEGFNMLISSQACQEWQEGSEARLWSPERTVKAHERGAPDMGDDMVPASSESWSDRIKRRSTRPSQDMIYIVSPVDNPVASMSKTIRATGKIHEWTEDKLLAAASNKAVEGAAAPADVSAPVTELSNYCQIMTKRAEITGTLEDVTLGVRAA